MNKAYIPLVVGVVVGVVAIKMGIDVVKRAKGAGASGNTISVVVAAKTIPLATEITDQMLTTVSTSEKLVPSSAFLEKDNLIGRVSRTEIPQGMALVNAMLAPPGTPAGMPSRIPEGYRAVSVKVDEASQVGGFLQPGCFVDVAVVMSAKIEGRSDTISRVILQGVQVAAVGQSLEGEASGATLTRSVTLLLRPDDVPKLHLAATKGKIHLAMRNQADDRRVMAGTTNETELVDDKALAGGSDGSPLGMLLHGLASSLRPHPEPEIRAIESVESSAPAVEPSPWAVEMVEGNRFSEVVFRSADSMDRVGSGGINTVASAGRVGSPGVSGSFGTGTAAGRSDAAGRRVMAAPSGDGQWSTQQQDDGIGASAERMEE